MAKTNMDRLRGPLAARWRRGPIQPVVGLSLAALCSSPTLAQTGPDAADAMCRIPMVTGFDGDPLPGSSNLQTLQKRAMSAYFRAWQELQYNRSRQPGVYDDYLANVTELDRAIAPLVDQIEDSEAGVQQFTRAEAPFGTFALCIEKQGGRSAIADRMRRKAVELAPVTKRMWEQAQSDIRSDQEFERRTAALRYSKWLNVGQIQAFAAAGVARSEASSEANARAVRSQREKELAEFRERERMQQAAAAASAAEVASRDNQRLDAERRGRASGAAIASFAIANLRLGTYPTSEQIIKSAQAEHGCSAIAPLTISEEGTGGNRTITTYCALFGLPAGDVITYTLGGYRLTEITQTLPGPNPKICAYVSDEIARTDLAAHSAQYDRAGWKRIGSRQIQRGQSALGTSLDPWRVNLFRQGNVMVQLQEYEQGAFSSLGCGSAYFRKVRAIYTLTAPSGIAKRQIKHVAPYGGIVALIAERNVDHARF